jgi:hypothetical protein
MAAINILDAKTIQAADLRRPQAEVQSRPGKMPALRGVRRGDEAACMGAPSRRHHPFGL